MIRLQAFILLLVAYVLAIVSAQNNQTVRSGDQTLKFIASDNTVKEPVEDEKAKAVFVPDASYLVNGDAVLHCSGPKAIKDRLVWLMNGREVASENMDREDDNLYRTKHKVATDEEAYYSCNGVGVYMIKKKPNQATAMTSVWAESIVTCIDSVPGEEVTQITGITDGIYETEVYFYAGYRSSIYPLKDRKILVNSKYQCNNTDEYTFIAEPQPTTSVEFRDKKVICTSSDTKGRCALTIYFGKSLKAIGASPVLEYKYTSINIKQVRCIASCQIGDDIILLPLQSIEINRTLYIVVIFVIILIILIIIIIICCVLWHKFGFKEKYGYQINMRLKRSFDVDNKLSSYRLSGVQVDAGAAEEDSDNGDDVTKEFRDMDDTGSVVDDDSFVDPNFARTNQKIDMRSKDDISSQASSNHRPFLRI